MIQIPGFEIIERIGVGGMAEVWKARQVSLDRIVAVKVLSAQFSQAPDDVRRFQMEAQSAAKLKHPGIVQVYDANAVEGTYYFVMEFVAGYTAGELLRRKGVVPERDALLVSECVADALGYAWDSARIIHCDIKPDNIMVDADGSVKVTDLGLARTISAMSGQGLSEEVLGTPAYMPPEQARGEADLDFRADIYALGATLYHMLTGKLLFHGNPDERVMEMQVTDTVSDPIDVNPSLSKGVSWLLEKMMAKGRGDRHESWQAVRADLARVRNGMMPHGRLAPKAASTVTRSSKRVAAVSKVRRVATAPAAPAASSRSVPMWVFLLVLGLGALLVALLLKLLEGQSYTTPTQAVTPVVSSPPEPATEAAEDREAAVRDLFERTRQWADANPGNYDEAIARYRVVAKKAVGTDIATSVHRAIRELTDARLLAVDKAGSAIRVRAAELAREKGAAAAADYLDTYSGPYGLDTLQLRQMEASRYRSEHAAAEKAKRDRDVRVGQKYEQALDSLAGDILDKGIDSARGTIAGAMADPDLAPRRQQLEPLKKLLDAAADMDARIVSSFLEQRGQTVTVQLSNGMTKSFRVEGVQGGKVFGSLSVNMSTAVVMVEYSVRDLSVRERLQRMGADTDPAVALVKGQMAFVAKAYAQALAYFRSLPDELAQRLIARVSGLEGAPSAAAPAGDARPAAAVEERPVPARPGGARTALKPAAIGDVGEAGQKTVRDLLAANRQVAEQDIGLAVDAGGSLAGIEIRSPDVHDLSALSRVTALRSLVCGVPGRQTALGALVALRGLPLERLHLARSSVKDLSSLRGMPLVEVDISHTPVSEIDVLRGMPLEHLSLSGTSVRDLSALRGMPLVSLDVSGTPVYDFSALGGLQLTRLAANGTQLREAAPLQNMPLRELDVGNSKLRSFEWLQQMPIEVLNVENTQMRDLGPLKGKRLRFLNAAGAAISDIAVLRDMPLAWLSLAGTTVSDLSPLKGAPLKELNLSNTHVADLEPLKQLPIESLNLEGTSVADLEPLAGMPLRRLDIQGTKVRDLAVVSKLSLVSLKCQRTRIRSLHALNRSSIQELWVDSLDESSKSVLRSMPNLRVVNGVAWARW